MFSDLFGLLGWDFKPLPEFVVSAEPLGPILDLSLSAEGLATIRNKPSRVKEISALLSEALSSKTFIFEAMRSLRGRLVHACAQTVGRFGGAALADLGKLPEHHGSQATLFAPCLLVLRRLLYYLQVALPRSLKARHVSPVLLFVDGAADPNPAMESGFDAGVGGCVLAPCSRQYLFFGAPYPPADPPPLGGPGGGRDML